MKQLMPTIRVVLAMESGDTQIYVPFTCQRCILALLVVHIAPMNCSLMVAGFVIVRLLINQIVVVSRRS